MTWASIEEITAAVEGSTAPKEFLKMVASRPDAVALRSMAGDSPNAWNEWTWSQYAENVAKAAAGLQHFGVKPGERVLLMMRNRPDFHWFDTAVQFLRATAVSIYNSSAPEEIAYLAGHAEAEIAIVEDIGFLERILKVHGELPLLQHLFVLEDGEGLAPAHVKDAAELMSHGAADLQALGAATQPDDLATLIYTSGTTGPPKGVMLSQFNIVYTAEQLLRCFKWSREEIAGKKLISYLPMAHIAERMSSHYNGMIGGLTVTTCPDPTQIATYAREVRPNIMFGVPRVWEKVYAGVNGALALDPEKKEKFDEAVAAAIPIRARQRAGTASKEDDDTWAFLDAVAFSTVRGLVGLDELESAITGAAPITREILEWFDAIGVPLSEIYGMSESSGPMTWEAFKIKPGTVGPAIPGCEVRIADDGEVICRGGNVFQGYLKSPEKTAETIIDGWLHSGDIGEMDEDGYVRIVDRKKELIITSGGKNISPANLESALKTIPLIGQAAAIGDARKYISALLVLDGEYAPVWARNQGIEFESLEELAANEAVIAEVQQGVDQVNQRFAQVEQIKKFTLLGEEWLPDSDLLTPTSKLKRRGINAKYADAIEAMYADA
ncbi:MAG TPA: long-chain fatty acid--CoA ligase [Acidimicrobiales bacterium]